MFKRLLALVSIRSLAFTRMGPWIVLAFGQLFSTCVVNAATPAELGRTYFNENCSTCHSVSATELTYPKTSPFTKVFSLEPLGSPKQLNVQLLAAMKSPRNGSQTMRDLASDLANLANVAAYFRSSMKPASVTVTKSFTGNSPNPFLTFPTNVSIEVACTLNSESTFAATWSIDTHINGAGSINNLTDLKVGESCSVTQNPMSSGSLAPGFTFGTTTVTPNALTLVSINTVTINTVLVPPPAVFLAEAFLPSDSVTYANQSRKLTATISNKTQNDGNNLAIIKIEKIVDVATDNNSSFFSISGGTCLKETPKTLPASNLGSNFCTVEVSYAPLTAGSNHKASFNVTHDAPGSPARLTGRCQV